MHYNMMLGAKGTHKLTISQVQHHESHPHQGMCPHEHWIDLRDADVRSISKGGDFNQYRQDVRPADWA